MKIKENKEKAIEYLLGELAENERDDFETVLFSDEDLSTFLEDVENDLIDEYVRGELDFEVKRRFEKNYLTSETRLQRVDLARTLDANLFSREPVSISSSSENTSLWKTISTLFGVPNPVLAGGMAAFVLLILFGGFWFLIRQNNTPIVAKDNSNITENSPSRVETPSPEASPTRTNQPNEVPVDPSDSNVNPENLNGIPDASPTPKNSDIKPGKTPKAVPQQSGVFAFSLLSPLRGSTVPVLEIPTQTQTIRLQLLDNFPGQYKKFTLDLNDAGGNTISRQEISNKTGQTRRSLSVTFTENKLSSGNYELAVRGTTNEGSVEEINFYNFVVIRK